MENRKALGDVDELSLRQPMGIINVSVRLYVMRQMMRLPTVMNRGEI